MAQSRKPTFGDAAEGDLPTRALIDTKFMMKLAQNITSTEQLQLGVFLDMKSSTVRDIMRDSDDAVTNSFTILEAWIDSRKNVGKPSIMYDELSGACVNIKRADLVDMVRCEQLHQLNEKLQKSRETAQSSKKHFNEQMLLVKVELRQTKEQLEETTRELQQTKTESQQTQTKLQKTQTELQKSQAELQKTKTNFQKTQAELQKTKTDFQKTQTELQKTKTELQKTEDEVRRLNELAEEKGPYGNTAAARPARGANKAAAEKSAPTEKDIKAIKTAAKPLDGESDEDKQLRALRVMAKLKEYGQPELWAHVAQYIVEDGSLDLNLNEVLTTTNLPDLVYLISSGEASDIKILNLSYNAAVFRDDDTARSLGTAVASLSNLRQIHLYSCQLTDVGLRHIVDGLTRGCPRLTHLGCQDWDRQSQLTSASEETLRRLLTRLPQVEIWLWPWGLPQSPPSWIRQLKAEFPRRVL